MSKRTRSTRRLGLPVPRAVLGLVVLGLGAVFAAATSPGCNSGGRDAPRAVPASTPVDPDAGGTCTDPDGGAGCPKPTPPCNPSDPTAQCAPCKEGHEGCPCTTPGEKIGCGKVTSIVGKGPTAQKVCGLGISICSQGKWGACTINNTVTLAPQSGSSGSSGSSTPGGEGLGGPSGCANNPCDPGCINFQDTPTGLPPDGGTVATDAGISLPLSDGGPPPPAQCSGGPTVGCAHSICGTGVALTVGCDNPAPATGIPALNCVQAICAAHPTCCTSTWDGNCAADVPLLCNATCEQNAGTCVVCYKDSYDHDGDGWSHAQGDCADCDPTVNPGAFDWPGDGIDQNCDGIADNELVHCDGALPMASSVAQDFASAINLCRTTSAAAPVGPTKTWGVTSAALTQADGASAPNWLTHGILNHYGTNNLAQEGTQMAVFSSGTARSPGDPNWVDPSGQYSSYVAGTSCSFPAGFPKTKGGCPNAVGGANDSSGLTMNIRVPTNARSFNYNFNFFSSEYPEWVCTYWNDSFVALLHTGYLPANAPSNNNNISFDSLGNPVSVNVGFFTVTSGPKLTGTAMDEDCGGVLCGGGTDWLLTTAPVVPGEIITMQFAIWDSSDEYWDSVVLVDNWNWSPVTTTIGTIKQPPPSPPIYSPGDFTRVYDATGSCAAGSVPRWGLWSWNATTPKDSKIQFFIKAATTQAGLASATEHPLEFSSLPATLVNTQALAAAGTPDTEAGSTSVDYTIQSVMPGVVLPVVQVRAHLVPSSDLMSAPVLIGWNQQFDCPAAE